MITFSESIAMPNGITKRDGFYFEESEMEWKIAFFEGLMFYFFPCINCHFRKADIYASYNVLPNDIQVPL